MAPRLTTQGRTDRRCGPRRPFAGRVSVGFADSTSDLLVQDCVAEFRRRGLSVPPRWVAAPGQPSGATIDDDTVPGFTGT